MKPIQSTICHPFLVAILLVSSVNVSAADTKHEDCPIIGTTVGGTIGAFAGGAPGAVVGAVTGGLLGSVSCKPQQQTSDTAIPSAKHTHTSEECAAIGATAGGAIGAAAGGIAGAAIGLITGVMLGSGSCLQQEKPSSKSEEGKRHFMCRGEDVEPSKRKLYIGCPGSKDNPVCETETTKPACPSRVEVNFEIDKAELVPKNKLELDNILNFGNHCKGITVIGHTDTRGKDDYNRALASRRAESIKHFLENEWKQKRKDITITVKSAGERNLLANPEVNDEDRKKNRRAEIIFDCDCSR
mgnify:CR=1 FL=1